MEVLFDGLMVLIAIVGLVIVTKESILFFKEED